MGVGSAFNTALGGLSAYSSQVGYISDNLANVSTPGFKRVDASFQSYTTLSTTNFHSPGGVTITPSYRVGLAGQINASDNPTSFAVSNGNGFAPVSVPSIGAGGAASFTTSVQHFTRECDFTVNSNGYLVNSSGQFLQGLQEQTTGKGDIPGTPSLASLSGVRVDPKVYKSIPGIASTTVGFNGNFPASAKPAAYVPNPVPPGVFIPGTTGVPASQVTSQVQFFDSLGNSRTLQLTYQKIPLDGTEPTVGGGALNPTASMWQLIDARVPGISMGPAPSYVAAANSGDLIMDPSLLAQPKLYFTATGALNDINPPGATVLTSVPVSIPWSDATSPVGATDPQIVTIDYGTADIGIAGAAGAPNTITTPASGSTQYAGTNLEVRSVVDQTGQAPGSFQKASIDSNGYVVFSYSNGAQKTPYRIPLVTFSDAGKLDRVTGSVFSGNETLAGPPVARWPGDGDSGSISPNSSEQSNVDIADELTKMIVAQRAYSSNGKVITTADEMIQEALGLKH